MKMSEVMAQENEKKRQWLLAKVHSLLKLGQGRNTSDSCAEADTKDGEMPIIWSSGKSSCPGGHIMLKCHCGQGLGWQAALPRLSMFVLLL